MNYFKDVIINKWKAEHSEFEQARKLDEKKIEDLKAEKKRIIDLLMKEILSEENGKEELSTINNLLLTTQAEVNENLIDRNELDVLLNQAELFLRNIEPLK